MTDEGRRTIVDCVQEIREERDMYIRESMFMKEFRRAYESIECRIKVLLDYIQKLFTPLKNKYLQLIFTFLVQLQVFPRHREAFDEIFKKIQPNRFSTCDLIIPSAPFYLCAVHVKGQQSGSLIL